MGRVSQTAEDMDGHTVRERDYLIHLGCDYLQGYLFSWPVPVPGFVEKFGWQFGL